MASAHMTGIDDLVAYTEDVDARLREAIYATIQRTVKRLAANIRRRVKRRSGRSRRTIKAEVLAGALAGEVYSNFFVLRLREDGTRYQAAHPAFWPSAEEEEPRFVAEMQDAIGEALGG